MHSNVMSCPAITSYWVLTVVILGMSKIHKIVDCPKQNILRKRCEIPQSKLTGQFVMN